MEEFPTTATLNEPASTPSTTQSDSTTPTAEATTVTGLQAPTTGKYRISRRAFMLATYTLFEKKPTILAEIVVTIVLRFWPFSYSEDVQLATQSCNIRGDSSHCWQRVGSIAAEK